MTYTLELIAMAFAVSAYAGLACLTVWMGVS